MTSSYDWVRTIKPELKALDAIPLTGSAPPFPWQDLASNLSTSFDQEISIQPGEIEWRAKEQLYEGLGESPFPLVFAIPSLSGIACWVMPEQEMAILESLLLTKDPHPISFQDRSLSESFYRFLALEVLYNISQTQFASVISPILLSQNTLPQEDSLCWDISISLQGKTLWGRLIISPELRRSWAEHFAKEGLSSLGKEIASKVDVFVHLEAGSTHLSLKEWTQISLGDWISLEKCSLSPQDLSGQVMLTVNGKNAFIGRLKDGNIKIVEFPLYQEVNTPMAKDVEHEDEDEFTDLGETLEDEDFEDADILDEDLELTDTTEEPSAATPAKAAPGAPEKGPETAQPAVVTTKAASGGPIKPEDIDVSLVVEVGRIQMTMQKLLALEPGNLLELDIHPEDGVDLVINGKVVGKGELVRVGEALGVRVIELGR